MIAGLVLAAVVTAPGTFRIDAARSEAGFELKATMHTVHGTSGRVTGESACIPEESGAIALTGRIDVDATSLVTGNAKRDATMRGKSLDVARFPSLSLAPERFVPAAAPAANAGAGVAGTLTGALTIRGTTRPVTIQATLVPGPDGIDVAGTLDVAWADFGIPDPSFLFVRIDKTVHAWFRARFVAAP